MKNKTRRLISLFVAIVICLSSSVYAAKPITVSGASYVPLREICNTLGVAVSYDNASKTINLNEAGYTVSLAFSGTTALINNADNSVIPVKLVNDKTYVPAAVITKLTGAELNWNEATQSYEVDSWGQLPHSTSQITISSSQITGDNLVVSGKTAIDTSKSTYIQYYIGKEYDGTISECIYCAGFNTNTDGSFELTLPTSSLKGDGNYKIVLEQNPNSDTILAPSHWTAFAKDTSGNVTFGDITSMDEISNLAQTVNMQIAESEFTVGSTVTANDKITITSTNVTADAVEITGKTAIDTSKSTYIQYYVGKKYDGTVSECILCNGINAGADGTFSLSIPVTGLKGNGDYDIVLEQNPASDTILAPSHWTAFTKDTEGNVTFGDITSMGEISNLALTVGMQTAASSFTVGASPAYDKTISIISSAFENGNIVVKGKTSVDTSKSTYIQYYVGKEYANSLSNCVVCSGFNANTDGSFELTIPYDSLKGNGTYTVVLEQNPNSDKILAANYWKAFYKDESGTVVFGSISSMKEISNLALTVGMKTAETTLIVAK